MRNDYRNDRYTRSVRYIEYEHILYVFGEDLSNIFDIDHNEHIHWFIEDHMSDEESIGSTRITCADDRTGQIILQQIYLETDTQDIDNHFYAKVVDYFANILQYDFGELLIDIQTPKDPVEGIDGALLKIVWTTYE